MRRYSFALFVVALTAGTVIILIGAGPQGSAGEVVAQFRASIQLVQLDVVVTGPAGRRVTTLTADDFDVRQDGKKQQVRFVQFVAGGGERTTWETPTTPSAPDQQRLASGARHVAIVVDDAWMNFDDVVRSKEALRQFVTTDLASGDLLAIASTRRGDTPYLHFTSDHRLLGDQIDRLSWEPSLDRAPLSRCGRAVLGDVLQSSPFAAGSLATLAAVLDEMRRIPGRKPLFLLADRLQSCPDEHAAFQQRLRRIADLANRSSVVIYGLHTLPFTSGVKMPEHRGTEADVRGPSPGPVPFANVTSPALVTLAERTGGFAERSNGIDSLLKRALDDQAGYYLLAYEPPADTFSPRKLKYHTVRVKVHQPGVSTRTRAGFYSVPDERLKQ
jgi:VWFA-related protein